MAVLASLAALLPAPAAADFLYVAPEGPRPGFTAPAAQDTRSLAHVLRRLAPAPYELRFDRRVDAGQRIDRDYADWRSLLFGEGLAHTRHGEEIHVHPAGIAAGDVELVSATAGATDWRIQAGETLREILDRWTRRTGYKVLVLTDRRYRLEETRTWRGRTFADAVRTLMFALAHLPHPPAAELADGGTTLVVTHRAPPGAVEKKEETR